MFMIRHARKITVFVILAMLLGVAAMANVQTTSAQTLTGDFSTAFRVQNLGTGEATCNMVAYDASGTQQFENELAKIPAGTSAYVYTPATEGQGAADGYHGEEFPAGEFAVALSCDQKVAAVVNFSEANKGDTYVGVSDTETANRLLLPMAYNNFYGYYTTIRVQNPTSSNQSVTLEFYDPTTGQKVAEQTKTVNGNSAVSFEQSGDMTSGELAENVAYSVVASGDDKMAVIGIIHGSGGTANQLYSYSSFADGSTDDILAPVIMANFYGYNSATTVQNADTTDATVTINYIAPDGSTAGTDTATIGPGASNVFVDYENADLQQDVLYKAKIESDKNIIVTVNESTPTTNRATTYEGQPTSNGSTKVVVPLVMKKYYGYNSSITCMGTNATVDTFNVTYSGTNLAGEAANATVNNLKPMEVFGTPDITQARQAELPDGWSGSAVIEASNPIICEVNQDQNDTAEFNAMTIDQLYGYNALASE
jgi:hypothetical protein